MQAVRRDPGAIEVVTSITGSERIAWSAFAVVLGSIGVTSVAIAARVIPIAASSFDTIGFGVVGMCFLGFGFLIGVGATPGKRTTRFDWQQGTFSDTRWHFRGGHRQEVWPLAAIGEISVMRLANDGGTALDFGVQLRLASGKNLGTVATFTNEAEAGHLAEDLRRHCGAFFASRHSVWDAPQMLPDVVARPKRAPDPNPWD
jgi:hypothetical protein